MFEPILSYVQTNQTHLNKAGKNARQVQIRECFPQPLKERLDEGREMRRGKENAFGDRDFFFFFIENEEGRGWPTVRVI